MQMIYQSMLLQRTCNTKLLQWNTGMHGWKKLLYETTTDAEDSESFLLFSERDEQRVENSLENNSRAKT